LLSGIRTNSFLFVLARFLTGLSVGGEFTAIFTAVDEFLPPRYRGRVNIGIDGTWHLGGTMASLLTMAVGETENWRSMFLLGIFGILSLILMRRGVPESPRWLIAKNKHDQAQRIIEQIEYAVENREVTLREEVGESMAAMGVQQREEEKSVGDYCL
jgi:MFS family permease